VIGIILEILMLVSGVYSLITAKPLLGKEKIKHTHYRFLGAFQVALLPVALAFGIVAGIVIFAKNPNQAAFEQAMADHKFLFAGVEFGLVILWVIISSFWDKAIRTRAAAGR
jgi:hypothetical protein